MKKVILALAAALLIFPTGASASTSAPDEALRATGAKGAVLMEASSGRVLYEKDGRAPLPIASTTKIMTAILTLEQPGLDESFVVDPDAIRVEGTSMGLVEGDQVTLRTLAWGMLLASGNDAANAAAVRIAGSTPAFCDMMNEKAAELGMEDTHFDSPSGLDIGEHHSSAYDMALLARYALENDDFTAMARSKSAKVSFGNPPYHRWLTNHNRLLWQCEDCIGIKTGFTKKAGRCLVTAAQRDGLTLIAVTLGCPDDFNVHHGLYDQCFADLSFVDMSDTVSNLSVPVTGGLEPRAAVRPLWPLGAYLTESERGLCRLSLSMERFVYAPAESGQVVGEAALLLDGRRLAAAPLVVARRQPARFVETRGILQQVKDFFAYPQNWRFPLNGPSPASPSRAN